MRWRNRMPAAEPPGPADAELAGVLAARLDAASQARLGRSLGVFHVSGGGCNGCEREIRMLRGVAYDLERLGLAFVGGPQQADVLLITGPVTRNLAAAVRDAWSAAPAPKWVVASGDCAINGGLFADSYAVFNGAAALLPVDLTIPGCPPSPAAILAGLRTLIEANG